MASPPPPPRPRPSFCVFSAWQERGGGRPDSGQARAWQNEGAAGDGVKGTWFLLAHGAGAGSASSWMQRWREHLASLGPVVCFDYPYVQAGRRRPDPLARLVEAHREALHGASAQHPGIPVLVGKSLGSRVGCHLSLTEHVGAVVCLGYPLKSPAASPKTPPKGSGLRDQVLLEMRTPVLFVQGTRDPLCPLELLQDVRSRMTAPSELHVVPTGDHSLVATKAHLKLVGTTQATLERDALAAVGTFVARHLPR